MIEQITIEQKHNWDKGQLNTELVPSKQLITEQKPTEQKSIWHWTVVQLWFVQFIFVQLSFVQLVVLKIKLSCCKQLSFGEYDYVQLAVCWKYLVPLFRVGRFFK